MVRCPRIAHRAGDFYLASRSAYDAAQEGGLFYLPTGEHLRKVQRSKGGTTGHDDGLYSEFNKVLDGLEGVHAHSRPPLHPHEAFTDRHASEPVSTE